MILNHSRAHWSERCWKIRKRLPSLLTGIWSLNAAIISSRTSGNLTSILRVNGVPMRWVSSSLLLRLTGRPISIFWVGSDIVANSGREGYFSSSIPNWKNVIGSTTNLLNLVRSRSNNHPLGNRWYSEDRSTILGIFHQIQIEGVSSSSFNYLIVTLFDNFLCTHLKSIRSDVWIQWVRRPNGGDRPQLKKQVMLNNITDKLCSPWSCWWSSCI